MNWLKRAWKKLRQLGGGSIFKAAEISRLTLDWIHSVRPADDELRWSLMALRARSRDLSKNNAYVKAYLRLLVDNVIGPHGIKHQAMVRNNDDVLNEKINERIEKGWIDWSRDVTTGTRLTLTAFSRQVLAGIARDGEAFIRVWSGYPNKFGLALEYIDPDQVDEQLNRKAGDDENEIAMGIEKDSNGRPVAYHVWSQPRYVASPTNSERVRIPAEEVIHLYHPERCNQSRGTPWSLSAMYALRMLDGYEEAVLVNARVTASKMGFLVRKDDSVGMTQTDPVNIEANPGTFETLPPGYTVETFDTGQPSAEYPFFVKAQLRKIASALGISYNLLASDLEGVNYSSMRSGLLSDRDNWRGIQSWWIDAFLVPVYEKWMRMAVLTRAVSLDTRAFDKLLEAAWTPRGWAWVDPLKDIEAGILGIQNGLASRTSLLAEQGLDFEDMLEDLKQEEEMAATAGVEIKVEVTPVKDPNQPAVNTDTNRLLALANGRHHG